MNKNNTQTRANQHTKRDQVPKVPVTTYDPVMGQRVEFVDLIGLLDSISAVDDRMYVNGANCPPRNYRIGN